DKARRALGAGAAVVLDATFSTRFARAAAGRVAAEVGLAFDGLFLEAPLSVRLARVEQRRGDASDADMGVARRQQADPLRERGWAAIDASGSLAETVALAANRLGAERGSARG
uniref:AAA family ATPase n=1 Tax=Roseiarcus sp. TaxID=1969460 RepID=UPI003F9E7BA8